MAEAVPGEVYAGYSAADLWLFDRFADYMDGR